MSTTPQPCTCGNAQCQGRLERGQPPVCRMSVPAVVSAHRLIQLRETADKARAAAQANRRAACNAAAVGMQGAARMLSAKASKAEGLYRDVCTRIIQAVGFTNAVDL